MNAVTVPSDTRVRARLDRESQKEGGPAAGAASEVKPTVRRRRASNQVWQATIAVDVPAGSVHGPTRGAGLQRKQAGAAPARSDFISKCWAGRAAAAKWASPRLSKKLIHQHVSGSVRQWPVSHRAGRWARGRRHVLFRAVLAGQACNACRELCGERVTFSCAAGASLPPVIAEPTRRQPGARQRSQACL